MKKLLTVFSCVLIASLAFGQWEMNTGPVYEEFEPSEAIALDSTTILAMDYDVVKKSIDFGETWVDVLESPKNMREIEGHENVIYICADDGLIYKSSDAGDTWTEISDTNFVWDLDKLDVVDSNNVYLGAEDGYVVRTLDGGANWDTLKVDTDDDINGGVAFADASNGIAFSNGTYDAIYTTHDGGATWAASANIPIPGTSTRQYDAVYLGSNTFLVSAYNNVIWKSTDLGDTWVLCSEIVYEYEYISNMHILGENTVIAATSKGNLLTTTDAGTTWDTLSAPSGQNTGAMAFSSLERGILWQNYKQVFKTTDGENFEPIYDWPAIPFYALDFIDEDKLIVTANSGGEITMSNDNGATWSYPSNMATGAPSSIFDVKFIDADTGLLGGTAGLIAKTVDGGVTWTSIDNPMFEEAKHIYFIYIAPSGDIFAGGQSGYLIKSTDNGDTWTKIESGTSSTVNSMSVFSNGLGYLGASKGSWCISTSTVLDTFTQACRTNAHGYGSIREAKERNGVILVPASDDIYVMGENYDTLYSVFDIPLGKDAYALEWVSDSTAFFVGQSGIIYRTDDAGGTWEQEFSGADNYIYDLKYDGEKLWAVGKYALIMSRDYMPAQADYSEEFTDGTADLTWLENTAADSDGSLNLTVAADSAGLTNVGIWTDDGNTGLIYPDLDKKLKNYEVSADVYCVKGASATEPLYKGIAIKMDPVNMEYYRFVYRNSSTSSGALKLQGFDGANWYISKQWNAGEDFDTLETGFHNLKAQVIDNKFWLYVDGELLPGCPYTHDGEPVVSVGYPGMYVYTGTNEFDNFKVTVYEFEEETSILNNDIPSEFVLEQNYPNPFNPTTTLNFQIPNANMVAISIYNVAGRKVAEVMNGYLNAGFYSVNFNASALPSGVYLYRLTAGEFSSVKKMTLLK